MNYKSSTLWLTIMAAILVTLMMLAGYWERGYFAFDGAFVILILSPVVITYWYKSEKERYEYRKAWRGRKNA